jgi:protein tyrosine phosphatase (PTP) superfamily phosphohydrolase (DUF442 family)
VLRSTNIPPRFRHGDYLFQKCRIKILDKQTVSCLFRDQRLAMDSITEKIWIGNYLDAKDHAALAQAGIRSILCLDGCMADASVEQFGVERVEVVELIDGAGNPREKFLRAVKLLGDMTARHAPVLVHCHAGQSRSAAVVCKYFMREEGDSLAEAMRRITSKRRVAIIAGLQEALDF